MIIICNNDIIEFALKLVMFDLISIIIHFTHYNTNKSFCHVMTDSFSRLVPILTFLLCHW